MTIPGSHVYFINTSGWRENEREGGMECRTSQKERENTRNFVIRHSVHFKKNNTRLTMYMYIHLFTL